MTKEQDFDSIELMETIQPAYCYSKWEKRIRFSRRVGTLYQPEDVSVPSRRGHGKCQLGLMFGSIPHLISTIILFGGLCTGQTTDSREEQLLRVLKGASQYNSVTQLRAVQELCEKIDAEPRIQKALIEYLFSPLQRTNELCLFNIAQALSRAERVSEEQIIQTYLSARPDISDVNKAFENTSDRLGDALLGLKRFDNADIEVIQQIYLDSFRQLFRSLDENKDLGKHNVFELMFEQSLGGFVQQLHESKRFDEGDVLVILQTLTQVLEPLAIGLDAPVSSCDDGVIYDSSLKTLLTLLCHTAGKSSLTKDFLLKELERVHGSADKLAIRAALLNMHVQSDQVNPLLEAVKSREKGVGGALTILGTGCVKCCLNKAWVEALVEYLNSPDSLNRPESCKAAIVLSAIMGHTKCCPEATEVLEKYWKVHRNDSFAVVYGFCLANTNYETHNAVLLKTLQHVGSKQFVSHTDLDAIDKAVVLLDSNSIDLLGALLSSRDVDVVTGATRILSRVGLKARKHSTRLIEFIQPGGNFQGLSAIRLKGAAAVSLATVGETKDLGRLRKLAGSVQEGEMFQSFQSTFLGSFLSQTIDVLELEQSGLLDPAGTSQGN